MDEKVYQFVGEGAGVVGLPHRVRMSELSTEGQKILQQAIADGVYREQEAVAVETKTAKKNKSAEGGTTE